VSDREGDPVRVSLEFRRTGSDGWISAAGLGFSGPFTRETYTSVLDWNSAQDLPEARLMDIDIRVVVMDTDTTRSDVITPVTISNERLPGVTRTTVVYIDESADRAGFTFELMDPGGGTLDLMVDFSTDGGATWSDASVSGELYGITGPDYTGSFIWAYGADLTGGSGSVVLRITPFSGDEYGIPLLLDLAPR
jgi:hypothetical protein